MKYCKNCGAENNNENQFCFNCRCDVFSETPPVMQPIMPPPMPMPMPMPIPVQMQMPRPAAPKKPLGVYDIFAMLGFVASIVGMFAVSIILHPVAAISSIVGFIGNTRFKPLALTGFVISIIGGIIFTVLSLYRAGLIPEWITDGAFH